MISYRCGPVVILILIFGIEGCATSADRRDGLDLIAQGRFEDGLAKIEKAVKEHPSDHALRTELIQQRAISIDRLLGLGASQELSLDWTKATATYARVIALDPRNDRAQAALARIERETEWSRKIGEAESLFDAGKVPEAGAIVTAILRGSPGNSRALALDRRIRANEGVPPVRDPSLSKIYPFPVNLEFRDANLKMVFEVLSKSTGINFVLDRDIRADLRTTIFLRNAGLDDAVNLLLLTNKLEKKVLSENSVLVYAKSPEKAREYQDLVIRSFYLLNADGQQAASSLKTLLKIKDVVYDEKLNLIIIRDTPDVVELADKVIQLHDLSEPEVMLELEVLEVQTSRLQELGIVFPQQLAFAPLPASDTGLTVQDLKDINSSRIAVSVPDTLVNLKKETGAVNLLANPKVRVKNKGKAKVLIGDRVPVITSTSTATGFVSENVQYIDVGLKLDIEPVVFLKDDVAINVALEVSSIAREIRSPAGTVTFQIGTRNASTILRLKDGETQILAGLINDQDRRNAAKVPGLGDIPLLGRLFSSHKDDVQKTEIILSITPRLVRNLSSPNPAMLRLWSGTEESVRAAAPIRLTQLANDPVELPAPAATNKTDAKQGPSRYVSPSVVSFELRGPAEVLRGENFEVELWVKADGGLRNVPLQIGFDPKVVQYLDASEGDYFSQKGGQISFAKSVDAEQGRIFVSIGRSGIDGASGEGRMMRLTFKAVDASMNSPVRLLSASPIVVGDGRPAIKLPKPKIISIKE